MPKEKVKKSKDSKKLEEAITFLLDELESIQTRLKKVEGRMGLSG